MDGRRGIGGGVGWRAAADFSNLSAGNYAETHQEVDYELFYIELNLDYIIGELI